MRCFPEFHVGLVHYPVLDRGKRTVATSTVSYDLHDIARLSKTYGVKSYYLITPLRSQILLIERLTEHWVHGFGAQYNSNRKEALELVRIQPSIEATLDDLAHIYGGRRPTVLATSARGHRESVGFLEARRTLGDSEGPYLLLFGTGWGMAPAALAHADLLLEPIEGVEGYNHLSVRAAAAIVLDRLIGQNQPRTNFSGE